MSVYSFGKIVSDDSRMANEQILRLAGLIGIEIKFGVHEEADQDILEESDLLKGSGVVFNLFTPGESDVITLCNEAAEAGLRAIRSSLGEGGFPYSWDQARNASFPDGVFAAMLKTRFGRFVDGLFQIEDAMRGGLAIFDNGVEQVIAEPAANCRSLILRTLLLPWDLGPNALFVWNNKT